MVGSTEYDVLHHAIGAPTHRGAEIWRNRYVAATDDATCSKLVDNGMMIRHNWSVLPAGESAYTVTDSGKNAVWERLPVIRQYYVVVRWDKYEPEQLFEVSAQTRSQARAEIAYRLKDTYDLPFLSLLRKIVRVTLVK